MSNVIHLNQVGSDPLVDSRELADGLGVQHHSVMRLIDRYQIQFARFGLVRFEIDAVKEAGARGVKQVRFASLNEDQAYLLLTMSRNTDRVVAMKADLVAAFGAARRAGFAKSLTAWQQLQRLEIENASSMTRASIGSRLMLERKRALPQLRARREQLEAQVIVPLFPQQA